MRQRWHNWRWARLGQKAAAHEYIHPLFAAPWPDETRPARQTPMLALDLETSGLDPKKDRIVSVGWVPIEQGRVVLGAARRYIVRGKGPLPVQSVVVHGLGDDQVASGQSIAVLLRQLLPLMAGRVLVAHNAGLDAAFLAAACERLWHAKVAFPAIDTLGLLERLYRRRGKPLSADALTLTTARSSFGLPRYPAHDALWDAIGAAELWLALLSELAGTERPLPLRRVLQWLP